MNLANRTMAVQADIDPERLRIECILDDFQLHLQNLLERIVHNDMLAGIFS